jgi:Enoyl-(Acyl carrier protein) reductase
VQKTVNEYGRIDVLVNNAAFQGTNIKDISELTRERVERTFKVTALGFLDSLTLLRKVSIRAPMIKDISELTWERVEHTFKVNSDFNLEHSFKVQVRVHLQGVDLKLDSLWLLIQTRCGSLPAPCSTVQAQLT